MKQNIFFSESSDIATFLTERPDGNMALHVGDEPRDVIVRREEIAEALNIDVNSFVFMDQVHGDNVAVVHKKDFGRGSLSVDDALAETDAMITSVPSCTLMVQVADCVPILLYDPVQRVIGVVHAGWRGTVKRIVQKTIQRMISEYSCKPTNIHVGIGPAIGPCCYTVGEDVVRKVAGGGVTGLDRKTMKMDLWKANKDQLLDIGIRGENIEVQDECTSCNIRMWYSYRREGDRAGRIMIGITMLNR